MPFLPPTTIYRRHVHSHVTGSSTSRPKMNKIPDTGSSDDGAAWAVHKEDAILPAPALVLQRPALVPSCQGTVQHQNSALLDNKY
jgi:hypothetical protein